MLRARFKLVRLVSCSVALALTLTANGLAQTPAQPIDIPVILSLTGPAAFVGKDIQQALRILEAATNASGGKAIHFDIVDDQTSPSVAVQLATGILDKGNTLILGPILVGTCAAVQPLLKDRAVEYCLSPGIDPPEGGYMFSSGISAQAILIASLH